MMLIVLCPNSSQSQENEGERTRDTETIPLEIRTESMNMNLESDVWRIPDEVEIEYETFIATGVNLIYDMKKNRGTLDGNPKITATYGTDTKIDTGHIDFDLDSELLTFSGGCNFFRKNASGTIEFNSDKLFFQMKEGWLSSPGPTTLNYEAPGKEGAAPDGTVEEVPEADEADAPANRKIKINAFDMTTGPMIYMSKEEQLSASGPVRIEFEEGYFEAGGVRADMKNEIMDITGGITGKFRKNSFSADSAQLMYGEKELTATGSVTFEKFDTDVMVTADKLWYKFKKDETKFDLTGNVHAKMNIKKKKSAEEGVTTGEKEKSEGSAP